MRRLRDLFGKAMAVLALVGAGAALPASSQVGDRWVADPDEQYVLDVMLKRLRLGDGVRAYNTPQGTCLVLGDFLQALDVPVKIDLATRRASGWAFKQENSVSIDLGARRAAIKGKSESFATSDVREVPEGWCVQSAKLANWFGIDLNPDTAVSVLLVDSTEKLPVELAAERRNRSVGLGRSAAQDLSLLPKIRLPYRMWRAPAFEFIVNAGATYSAKSGVKVDRSASIYAAGEVAAMSYRATAQTDFGSLPRTVRATLYRSDPDGGLFGPLKATHVAVGDVEGLNSSFGGTGTSGRGAVLTNQPVNQPARFDRTQFIGELPSGWDAELYRNGGLIAFFDSAQSTDGRYAFNDVDLAFGDNDFEVVLYGPQGQVERRRESVNVGRNNVPAGQLWYWAGVREPGKDLIAFGKKTSLPGTNTVGAVAPSRSPEVTLDARYGVDDRMSVGAMIRSTMIQDERVTFVEGSVRRSFGKALVEVAGAMDAHGRVGARAQVVAKLGNVSLNASSSYANGFGAVSDRAIRSEQRIGLSAPLRLGNTPLPVSADIRLIDRVDGTRALDASTRLGAQVGRFNLSSETHYVREKGSGGTISERLDTSLLASARVGPVRVRGSTQWQVMPQAQFRSAEVEADWSPDDRTQWQAGVAYEATASRVRGRVSHTRRFAVMDISLSGEAASDGSVAAGISLNFSMAPFSGSGFRPTREKLASSGAVDARVFEDLNENGRLDAGEPLAKNALITAGSRAFNRATDAKGQVVVGSLPAFQAVAIGIDQTTLDNPALTPVRPAQVVVPRPGVAAVVDIALVGGGSIEGIAVREDHREYEGVDIELVDASGAVVATARSDLDGYFLFERVRYGTYKLRLAASSAAAANALVDLQATAVIDRDKPLSRLGMVVVRSAPRLASSQ